jgi:hypothetical protein
MPSLTCGASELLGPMRSATMTLRRRPTINESVETPGLPVMVCEGAPSMSSVRAGQQVADRRPGAHYHGWRRLTDPKRLLLGVA